MISFESDVMSLSLLWLHPELPNLWQWELLFIHLSFCPCDFPKFSHSLPSAFFPKTWEVSFSVAWASHPFLLYLPFSAPSLLPCVLAELWRSALHRPPGCECPVPVPHTALSQGAWHPWNWGFKELLKAWDHFPELWLSVTNSASLHSGLVYSVIVCTTVSFPPSWPVTLIVLQDLPGSVSRVLNYLKELNTLEEKISQRCCTSHIPSPI